MTNEEITTPIIIFEFYSSILESKKINGGYIEGVLPSALTKHFLPRIGEYLTADYLSETSPEIKELDLCFYINDIEHDIRRESGIDYYFIKLMGEGK